LVRCRWHAWESVSVWRGVVGFLLSEQAVRQHSAGQWGRACGTGQAYTARVRCVTGRLAPKGECGLVTGGVANERGPSVAVGTWHRWGSGHACANPGSAHRGIGEKGLACWPVGQPGAGAG
jgi:hypothetical protein